MSAARPPPRAPTPRPPRIQAPARCSATASDLLLGSLPADTLSANGGTLRNPRAEAAVQSAGGCCQLVPPRHVTSGRHSVERDGPREPDAVVSGTHELRSRNAPRPCRITTHLRECERGRRDCFFGRRAHL